MLKHERLTLGDAGEGIMRWSVNMSAALCFPLENIGVMSLGPQACFHACNGNPSQIRGHQNRGEFPGWVLFDVVLGQMIIVEEGIQTH